MRRTQTGRAAWCALVVGLLAFGGLLVALAEQQSDEQERPGGDPVTRAQAEAVLADVVELVKRRELDKLCRNIAGAESTCRGLISSAERMGRYPGHAAPTVIGAERTELGLTLRLRVTGSAPQPFTANFPVIRDHKGELVALYPIYWSGVKTIDPPQADPESQQRPSSRK